MDPTSVSVFPADIINYIITHSKHNFSVRLWSKENKMFFDATFIIRIKYIDPDDRKSYMHNMILYMKRSKTLTHIVSLLPKAIIFVKGDHEFISLLPGTVIKELFNISLADYQVIYYLLRWDLSTTKPILLNHINHLYSYNNEYNVNLLSDVLFNVVNDILTNTKIIVSLSDNIHNLLDYLLSELISISMNIANFYGHLIPINTDEILNLRQTIMGHNSCILSNTKLAADILLIESNEC